MSVEEAQALMTEALTAPDRNTLLAERAEAEAQLRAAEATLGINPTAPNGDGGSEQEPDEAAQNTLDVDPLNGTAPLDVVELRRAATAARAADDALARAASEASERPPLGEAKLGTAESAFSLALEIQEDLPAAWRRLVGALISGTGMAIVIGALGWNTYWLLVPIALIAILTVDLRLSGKAAREASAEAARELVTVGGEGTGGLERVRLHRVQLEEAEGRLATARADRDAAYARFEELAPGRRPAEVEEVIAEYETEAAARAEAAAARAEAEAVARAEAEAARAEAESALRAEAERALAGAEAAALAEAEAAASREEADAATTAEAEAAAQAAPEPEVPVAPAVREPEVPVAPAAPEIEMPIPSAEAEPVVTVPEPEPEPVLGPPATATEWWFGSKEAPAPPAAASAPVRALAERLSAEGREALKRIEAQLAALDRVELAKKSLEWHEANGSAHPADGPPEQS